MEKEDLVWEKPCIVILAGLDTCEDVLSNFSPTDPFESSQDPNPNQQT